MRNKPVDADHNNDVGAIAKRLITLLDERDGLNEDIKELYLEAKGEGLDVPALRQAIMLKRKDRNVKRMVTVNDYLERMGELPFFALSKN